MKKTRFVCSVLARGTKTKYFLGSLLLLGTLQAQNNLTTSATDRYFKGVRRTLEATADEMPAEKYSFRIAPGQRTFAEWMVHSIQANYTDCAVMRGVPTPDFEKQAASLKEKAEVTKALKDSFVYCAEALQGMNDQKAGSSPQMSAAFLHLVVHNNEVFGSAWGYVRVEGSADRAKKK